MHVKKLILDGFKSYGKRTEIDGFDKEFTAITGLNGTGKSNILDAICFVLGIKKLQLVRATQLQELIFKNGQAGITKAAVSIVFDNTDPSNCPNGYEGCREITVTRIIAVGGGAKNKHLINGKHPKSAKAVADLFGSIQMNVNNANFLIMQGEITKMLNMKPAEILSKIEEASGTSLYETKRELTTKVIEKKDSKIKEMNSLLLEEINPRMDKLREEHSQYLEFQALKREIDYLTHISVSLEYRQRKDALANYQKSIESANANIEKGKEEIEKNIKEVETVDEECKEMQERIDAESGGELVELEKELATKSKTEATANGAKKSAAQEVDTEKRKLKQLQKNLAKDEELLEAKETKMSKVGDLFQSLKEADETDSKAFADAQKRLQTLETGLDLDEDGQATSLQEQLIATKTKLSEATTTIKKSEMDLKYTQKMLNEKENTRTTADASYQKSKQNLVNKEREFNGLKDQLSRINYEERTIERLDERQTQLNALCRQLQNEFNHKGAHQFEIQYRDPEPNFDRRKVRGMVCKLLKVRDPKYSLALSTCGGGRLYNVVVDDETVSKKILLNGNLQSRVTFIPMNKIRARRLQPERVQAAQRLVGTENCMLALDLIDYDPQLATVMEYVFGNTLICTDLATAKKVTYHPQVKAPTVTLDGDTVDPSGSLSGGAVSQQIPTLLKVAELNEFGEKLNDKRAELRQIQNEIAQVQPIANQYNQLKRQFENVEYELESIKAILAQTSYEQHQQEIEEARQKIQSLHETIKKEKEKQKVCTEKIKEMEANLKDASGYRERQLKEAKDNMQKLKSKSEKSKKEWKKHEQEAETLKLEIEELKTSKEKAKEEITGCEAKIEELETKLNNLMATSATASKEIETLKARIKEEKDSINSQHQELKKKLHRKDKLLKRNGDIELQIKKKQSELEKIRNDNNDRLERIRRMEEEHKWIKTDEKYFGVKNTKYDYGKKTADEWEVKLHEAEEKYNKIKKRVNEKAMMLLAREEEELKNVNNRKGIVEHDRAKITNILKDLDLEKTELLRKAWQEVDKNFGSIFSVLLPGAQATLVPTPGMHFSQGLNIKVGFNGIWKESLNELSGGQRSLVALSLILAMLKYKPAPIYILDEVDAALDMSHTQNIGQMLKMHFKNSQFIIVSLKDGMFNNANVIFKTKFENGVSGVIRTQNMRNK